MKLKLRDPPRQWKRSKRAYYIMLFSIYSIGFLFIIGLAVVDPAQYADPTTLVIIITLLLLVFFGFLERKNDLVSNKESRKRVLIGMVAGSVAVLGIGLAYSFVVMAAFGVEDLILSMVTTLVFYGSSFVAIAIFYLFVHKYVTSDEVAKEHGDKNNESIE